VLGLVQQDLLFEVVDLAHERDTQGALLFVERLSQGSTDYAQFIKDLLGHLRDVYVVKHTGEVPSSIAMTEDQQQILRNQASRVGTAETVTFIDLLGEALRSVRQGSDARLELELVLIKMTARHVAGPAGDATLPSASHTARRAEPNRPQPARQPAPQSRTQPAPQSPPQPAQPEPAPQETKGAETERTQMGEEGPVETTAGTTGPQAARPKLEPDSDTPVGEPQLEAVPTAHVAVPADRQGPDESEGMPADIDHFRRAWPLVLEAVKKRQMGLFAILAEGRPESVDEDTLVVKFPAGYNFQANMVGRGDNPKVIADAVYEIAKRHLEIVARVTSQDAPEPDPGEEDARILSKDELLLRLQQEFDARVIDDGPSR
jgi:DNA polymerase-3 subunit gamma/tau